MENLTDLVSELAVLSACINHGADCFLDISTIVNTDTFSDEQAQALWKCLAEIYKGEIKKADLPTILTTAKQIGLEVFFNTDERQKTLARILRFQCESQNSLVLAKKIAKLQITRELVKGFDLAKKDLLSVTGSERLDAIIAKAEKPVFDIVNRIEGGGKIEGSVHISEGIDALIKNIEENPNHSYGIPSGFPEWDEAIGGGLTPGVHLVCARLKQGKSHVCDNMAMHISRDQNLPSLVVDLEMYQQQHQFRLLSLLSGVPVTDIKKGNYVKNNSLVKKIKLAQEEIKNIPYTYIQASNMNMEERVSHIRRWLIRKVGFDTSGKLKPCVIFYDQLKITDMNDLQMAKENQLLGLQMDCLHALAVQYNIPIVALAQLNRDGINSESTAAVANSDKLAQGATSLTFLKPKSPEEIAKDSPELGNKKFVVVAGRDGPAHQEQGEYIHIGTKFSIAKMHELGSTARPKRMKQNFDIEAVADISF